MKWSDSEKPASFLARSAQGFVYYWTSTVTLFGERGAGFSNTVIASWRFRL